MKTYKHITNILDRSITACALNTFRKIVQPEGLNASYFEFVSSINGGVIDICVVDYETWELIEIRYKFNNGKHILGKVIKVKS